MSGRSPTLLVPAGTLGEATLTRIEKTLGAGDASVRTWRAADGETPLKQTLEDLLRVGGSPRLDVLIFVDGLAGADALPLVQTLSQVVATHFGAVFPASAPPEQRAVGIQVVVYTPPLVDSPASRALLEQLEGLLGWQAPHPTLARVWLAASQTRAGVLSSVDLVSQGTGFGLAVLGAGIRTSDAIERRLGHVEQGRIGFLSVGTLDLPLGRVEAWARVRAAYAALSALVERVAPAEGRMRGLEPEVVDRWIGTFEQGPEAEALKGAAWKLAGGREIPERITLGPLDGPESVRRRYAGLFVEPGDGASAASPAIQDALLALDRKHTEVLEDIDRAVRSPFAGRLGEVRPLADLPALEHALEQLKRRLRVREEPVIAGAFEVGGPSIEALEEAVERIPRPGVLRMLGLATALAVGFVLIGLTAAVLLRPPAAVATGMTTGVRVTGQTTEPTTISHVVPWAVGLVGGGVAGAGVFLVAGRRSRSSLLELLKARAEALKQARSSGLASGPSAEAAARLLHHRQRIRVSAEEGVGLAADRLVLIRDALHACRAALAQRLDGFGVPPRPVPDSEDLTPLFEAPTPFHAPLLGPDATRSWVRRARRFSEADVLADHVVDGLLPPDGLWVDVPASAPEPVLERAAAQTRALLETSLFDDPAASTDIGERTEAFARTVVHALAPGCSPVRADGMPATGVRPGSTFVVGPADGRAVLEDALARSQTGIGELYWTSGGLPLVLFVRTWEGFTLDELRRGVLG